MFNVTRVLSRLLHFQAIFSAASRYYSRPTDMSTTMDADVHRVLSFWFDGPHATLKQRWFFPQPGFDEEIQNNFGDLMKAARTTKLDSWTAEAKPSLALLILLDQFPRNAWRGTHDAFDSDAKASDVASTSIAKGFDREVTPFQQLFFYLPLVHGESVLSQLAAVSLLEGAVSRLQNLDSEEGKLLTDGLRLAKAHTRPILKFGRFPSRNKALGRETTKEEEEFLKEYPNGF